MFRAHKKQLLELLRRAWEINNSARIDIFSEEDDADGDMVEVETALDEIILQVEAYDEEGPMAEWKHDWPPAREAREKGYTPFDTSSPTGFRRPSTNCSTQALVYFTALATKNDGGKLAESEMTDLLTNPEDFFRDPWPIWAGEAVVPVAPA